MTSRDDFSIDSLRAEQTRRDEITDLANQDTDIENAAFFAKRVRGRLIYNHPMKSWMAYDEKRWKIDDNGATMRLAKDVAREMQHMAGAIPDDALRMKALKRAVSVQSRRRLDAMVFLAQSELPANPNSFNVDPYALNLLNGTLDVRTRTLRPHDPADFITKLAPVTFEPEATCGRWCRFIDEIMESDQDLVDFLQRFVGLCLSGRAIERLFAIFYGSGANGKTTFINVILALLGDYGVAVDPALFVAQRDASAASPELVRLAGARFVSASELPEGGRLSTALLKRWSGNDPVTARALYCDVVSFLPTWKLGFATNHLPVVRDDSEGFWDRLHQVPFAARFDGLRRDADLGNKLSEELSGILNWALDGFDRWQANGLNRPDRISSATSDYRADSDIIAAFIAERCVIADQSKVQATLLYATFTAWAKANGERWSPTSRSFRSTLRKRGFADRKSHGNAVFDGIGLLDEQHLQHPENTNDEGIDR